MAIVRIIDYLKTHQRSLIWIMLTLMALLVALDILIPSKYDRLPWDGIGGFGAFFGLLAGAVLILLSRLLGRVLYRSEDYYDD